MGHIILRNLMEAGFEGKLYAVNPGLDSVLGVTSYSLVEDVPDPLDLVVVAVPARFVPDVMESAGRAGVTHAIIISAGFREIGVEGAALEGRVREIALACGIRVVGPNCFGVINPYHSLNATFTSLYPAAGGIGFISQSGAVGSTLLDWSREVNAGFSAFVSVGNKMDLVEADLLPYLRDDPNTKVVGLYIEGITDGRRFMDEVTQTVRDKPVIALKSGRTTTGSRAASSHTGAISGEDDVYQAALEQMGAIRSSTLDDMFDLLQLFSVMPLPEGDGLAIVTNSGGLGVMAADACSDSGMRLARLDHSTVTRLRTILPEAASTFNPIDVLGDANVECLSHTIDIVLEDPNVHALVVLTAPVDMVDIDAFASTVAERAVTATKPMVAAFVGGKECQRARKVLYKARVPSYETPDRAVRALGAMAAYVRSRSMLEGTPLSASGDRELASRIIRKALAAGRHSLSEAEGKELLQAYGVAVPQEAVARSVEEAMSIAERIGYPVAMKIASPDIQHKTDIGGVALDVLDRRGLEACYGNILSRARRNAPGARIDGISIQSMARGREVLISAIRDPQFGVVLSFGMGGIFVEVLKDVTRRVVPLTEKDVNEMIRSIRSYPLLAGARGRRPADLVCLKELMATVAVMAVENPELMELEVNPVMVGEEGQGCIAVDALVTLRGDM